MKRFIGKRIIGYFHRFKTDLDCFEYLANQKCKNRFKCGKCDNTKCVIRKLNLARDCNSFHPIEILTTNTRFHKVKFGIQKAFTVTFEMSTTTKGWIRSTFSWIYEEQFKNI